MRFANTFLICSILILLATTGCKQRDEETAFKGGAMSQIAPGIQFASGTTSIPAMYYVTKIDLARPDMSVFATRAVDKKRTVSSFAKLYDCDVAINADFFAHSNYTTLGLAKGGGEVWPGSADNELEGFVGFSLDNKVVFSKPEEVLIPVPESVYSGVSGRPLLVSEGQKVSTPCEGHFCERHPRTAIGLSQDAKTLYFVVVDGNNPKSQGMTTDELGELMASIGVWQAINLDEGDSTAMFLKSAGGIVNTPSDKNERIVANHIGVCRGTGDDAAKREAFLKANPQ